MLAIIHAKSAAIAEHDKKVAAIIHVMISYNDNVMNGKLIEVAATNIRKESNMPY